MCDQKYAVGPTTLDDVVCPTVPDGVGPSILDQLVKPVLNVLLSFMIFV